MCIFTGYDKFFWNNAPLIKSFVIPNAYISIVNVEHSQALWECELCEFALILPLIHTQADNGCD